MSNGSMKHLKAALVLGGILSGIGLVAAVWIIFNREHIYMRYDDCVEGFGSNRFQVVRWNGQLDLTDLESNSILLYNVTGWERHHDKTTGWTDGLILLVSKDGECAILDTQNDSCIYLRSYEVAPEVYVKDLKRLMAKSHAPE